MIRERFKYIVIFLVVFVIEVLIGVFLHSGIIRNYIGDYRYDVQ